MIGVFSLRVLRVRVRVKVLRALQFIDDDDIDIPRWSMILKNLLRGKGLEGKGEVEPFHPSVNPCPSLVVFLTVPFQPKVRSYVTSV